MAKTKKRVLRVLQGPMQVPKSKQCFRFWRRTKQKQPGWTTRIYPILFIWFLKLHCGL